MKDSRTQAQKDRDEEILIDRAIQNAVRRQAATNYARLYMYAQSCIKPASQSTESGK